MAKKQLRFRTPFNFTESDIRGEINNSPSMTIPDQTMPMREILRRYASGLPFDNVKVPIYDGGDDDDLGIDFKKLDLAEIQAMREDNANYIETTQRDLQMQENKRRQAAQNSTTKGSSYAPPSGAEASAPKEPK